jgi:hypothetical protein
MIQLIALGREIVHRAGAAAMILVVIAAVLSSVTLIRGVRADLLREAPT